MYLTGKYCSLQNNIVPFSWQQDSADDFHNCLR